MNRLLTQDTSIFRYRSDTEKNINAFVIDKLYFSTPENFNDPYDSLFYINKSYFFKMIKRELDEHMDDYLSTQIKCRLPEVYQILQRNSMIMGNKLESRHIEKFFKNIDVSINGLKADMRKYPKIICFSKVCTSTLLWSHYANYHKGFSLVYDKNDLLSAKCYDDDNIESSEDCILLKDIEYRKQRFDLGEYLYHYIPSTQITLSGRYEIPEDKVYLPINALIRKSPEWNYEKEVRAILNRNPLKKNRISYMKIKPIAIILGASMLSKTSGELIYIARNKNIPIFKEYIKDSSVYRIEINELAKFEENK